MTAQNRILLPTPVVHVFKITKENKTSTIYHRQTTSVRHSFLTDIVRIEDYQGFGGGKDFNLYFRIKNQSSWVKSEAVTGLYPTGITSLYFGNRKKGSTKTLLAFKFDHEADLLTIFEYPHNYYPSRSMINHIVRGI